MAEKAQHLPKPWEVEKSYANVLSGKWRPKPPGSPSLEPQPSLAKLPAELIAKIVSHVSIREVKTLRLALRAYNQEGAKALFKTTILRPKQNSIANLSSIAARYPDFIKTIEIDLNVLWRLCDESCESPQDLNPELICYGDDRDFDRVGEGPEAADRFGNSHSQPPKDWPERHIYLQAFCSLRSRHAFQLCNKLEKLIIHTATRTTGWSGQRCTDHNPETIFLQLLSTVRIRGQPLKSFEIKSGRRPQLSMNLFSTNVRRYRNYVPMIDMVPFPLESHLQEEVAISCHAFRGLQELTLALYDHRAFDSLAEDRPMDPGTLPDVLRESAATLRKFKLAMSTPGEDPRMFARDVCPYHFAHGRHGSTSGLREHLHTFDTIMPSDVHFPKLELVDFMDGSTERLNMAFWSCEPILPDYEMVKYLGKAAGDGAVLSLLHLAQVENEHRDLCKHTDTGTTWFTYWSINGADLASMYLEAHMTRHGILLTIAYQVPFVIAAPGFDGPQSWQSRTAMPRIMHSRHVDKVQAMKRRELAGKDWAAIVELGNARLRLLRELLRDIESCQVEADGGQWSNVDPYEWALTRFRKNTMVFEVNGTSGLYVWSPMGWKNLMIYVSSRDGLHYIGEVFNAQTDSLNAHYKDDDGRAIAPSYLSYEAARKFRGSYSWNDGDYDAFRQPAEVDDD